MNREDVNIQILHSEPSFVVVEKPGDFLAVPGRGPDKQDCVVNRIKKIYTSCIDQPAVHRLDMQTSGLMVLALSREAHKRLSRQFEERLVKKRYIALLEGVVEKSSGRIQLPFRLDPDNRPYQIYDPVNGKIGITLWKKITVEKGKTRTEFIPLTGRTHQLRIHSAHPLGLGCPIVGDRLYGMGRQGDSMLLHASYLAFQHPVTGESLEFTSVEDF